jgi:hypothetical protein
VPNRVVVADQAVEAVLHLPRRQRLLRAAYTAARYGWPETPAVRWASQPERFDDSGPCCRPSRFLEAFTSGLPDQP